MIFKPFFTFLMVFSISMLNICTVCKIFCVFPTFLAILESFPIHLTVCRHFQAFFDGYSIFLAVF